MLAGIFTQVRDMFVQLSCTARTTCIRTRSPIMGWTFHVKKKKKHLVSESKYQTKKASVRQVPVGMGTSDDTTALFIEFLSHGCRQVVHMSLLFIFGV